MKIAHHQQTWKGTFTYEEGYDAIEQHIEVAFTMELTFTGTSFTGVSSDAESAPFFNEPVTVRGFMDDEKMSFVLNYPCNYYKDENGKITLDHDAKHPDIMYTGFFDGDKRCVSGIWEMVVYEEEYLGDYLEEIANGSFEMRRIT